MKIEINVDIESIVREEVRCMVRENVIITNIPSGEITEENLEVTVTTNKPTNNKTQWEYGRVPGKRRTTEQLALHKLEKEKGRPLTPEEKGQARARVEMDETAENKAKDETIKKARIDQMTAAGIKAANEELEAERLSQAPESGPKIEVEEIPKTEEFTLPKSLFT